MGVVQREQILAPQLIAIAQPPQAVDTYDIGYGYDFSDIIASDDLLFSHCDWTLAHYLHSPHVSRVPSPRTSDEEATEDAVESDIGCPTTSLGVGDTGPS